MVKKFPKVAVGGTFDQIHNGHMHLLEKAFDTGSFVAIGITTDNMIRANPKAHFVAKFEDRQSELLKLLSTLGVLNRAEIVPLNDPYGSAISDQDLKALIVSQDSLKNGKAVNEIRRKKGLKPLKLILVDTVLAEDGFPISSSRIRRGEIDREGRLLTS